MRVSLPALFGLVGIISSATVFAQSAANDKGVGAIEIDNQKIDISGNGYQRSYPCNGRPVIVGGSDHVLTFSGTCASLDVSGANNKVTIELAPGGLLEVAGSGHQVRWRSRGEPRQALSGYDNKLVHEPMPK